MPTPSATEPLITTDDLTSEVAQVWEAHRGLSSYAQFADTLAGKGVMPPAGVPSPEEEALQGGVPSPLPEVGQAILSSQPVKDLAATGGRLGDLIRGIGRALGRAIGLDEPGARTLGEGVGLATGLPTTEEVKSLGTTAGAAFTAGAALPVVGMAARGARAAGKLARLEHYSAQKHLTEISPEFAGTGQGGAELKRGGVPKVFTYREGTKPEPRFEGLTKYVMEVPEERIASGPVYDEFVKKYPDPDEREIALKKAGYIGYQDVRQPSPFNKVVALFEPVRPVHVPRPVKPLSMRDAKLMTAFSAESLYESGGSTYNLINGDLRGTKSFAVSAYPQYGRIIDGMASPVDIQQYIEDISKVVDLHSEDISIGTWYNTRLGRTELDVVITVDNYQDAERIARAHGQEAFYDLEAGNTIYVKKPLTAKESAQAGKADLGPVMALAGALAGGAFGYGVADEDKVLGALTGAGLGALAPYALPVAAAMSRRMMKAERPGGVPPAPPQLLHDFARQFRAALEEFTRGRVTHEMTREEAARLLAGGERDLTFFERTYPGQTLNAAEMALFGRVLTDEALKLREAAIAYAYGDRTQAAEVEFLTRLGVVGRLLPRFIGAEAEAGRTLEYLKEFTDEVNAFVNQLKGLTGKLRLAHSPARMAEIIASMKDPIQLVDFARKQTAPGLLDMGIEAWVNGLLSMLPTHAVNLTTTAFTMASTLPERLIAAGISKLPGVGSGEITYAEGLHMLDGFLATTEEAFRTMAEAFRTEQPVIGLSKASERPRAFTGENVSLLLQRLGLDPLSAGWVKAFDYLGAATRLPGRFLVAEDQFFKVFAQRMELNALTMREAHATARAEGLTGKAYRDRVNEVRQEILSDPAKWAAFQRQALEFSDLVTFTSELGPYGKAIKTLATHPVGRIITPFVTAPINIAKFAGMRTPFAVFAKSFRDDLAAGGARRDLALARLTLGSSIMSLFGLLELTEVVTGRGPENPDVRKLWAADGRRSYSINITGLGRLFRLEDPTPRSGDTWIAYSRFDPFGMLVGLAADAADLLSHVDDPSIKEGIAARAVLVAAKVMASKTYVQGISRWLLALSDPNRYAEPLEESFGQSLISMIPGGGVVKQIARGLDPVVREAHGFMDGIRLTIPGLSQTLPPVRNYWGEPLKREGWVMERMLSPFYRSTQIDDPVARRLAEMEYTGRPPERHVGLIELTDEEYDFLRQAFGTVRPFGGRTLYEEQKRLLDLYYDRTPPALRKDKHTFLYQALQRAEKVATQMARLEMYKTFNMWDRIGASVEERISALRLEGLEVAP